MVAVPSQSELSSYWYAALGEPLGLWLTTPDPVRLKSVLYAARTRSADPSLDHLQIRTSPADPAHTIWIVNPNGAASNPRSNPRSEDEPGALT